MDGVLKDFLQCLKAAARVEWSKIGLWDRHTKVVLVPVVVWRFVNPNGAVEARVVECMRTSRTRIEWSLDFRGRNWGLMPRWFGERVVVTGKEAAAREFAADCEQFRLASEDLRDFALALGRIRAEGGHV